MANTPTPPRVTNEYCLACHEKQDLKMVLPSGQELSLYIDKAAYAKIKDGIIAKQPPKAKAAPAAAPAK